MSQASLGQQIRALRKARRLSQTQLAEQAQVSARAIVYWESDQFTPGEFELKALLKALKIPASEQLSLLLLVPPRRGDKIIRGQNLPETQSVTSMPTAGDLLSALRSRQGLSREQVARTFGVAATTWGRWENSQYALPDDLLPRVQTLLNASPSEIQALQNRLVVPQEDTPFSVEKANKWAISFARHRYLPVAQAVDLDALALQRKLWRLHLTHPEARLPLAQMTLDYAVWLNSQNRKTEAIRQSRQALHLFAQDKNPLLSITGALNLLSLGQIATTGNPLEVSAHRARIAMHLLHQWLPSMGRPLAQTMVLTDLALLASRLKEFDMAHRYFRGAQEALAQEKGDQEGIHLYLQYSYATVLIAQRRPLEALNAMPHALPVPEQMAPGIGRFDYLLYTRLMLGLGEQDEAQKWLSHIYTSLDTVEIPRLRAHADALTRQLR